MKDLELSIQEQVNSIDISHTAYREAKEKYQKIAEWLQRGESKLARLSPDIYTQGSFALGTVIKPLNNRDDYDVDLVCHLKIGKNYYTQKDLKTVFGEELEKYTKKNNMSEIEEGRRCWKIIYTSGSLTNFHIDALPSISDLSYEEAKLNYENSREKKVFEINITDNKDTENYEKISEDWNVSNPKGYYEWFNSKHQLAWIMANNMMLASVESVPRYAIKTPLQKAIQFLKRHRDAYFCDDNDVKPISIIITTLVAQTYIDGDSKILKVILGFINNYHEHIHNDCIFNPVNPEENFADKWNEYPERKEAFYKWMKILTQDFGDIGLNNESYEEHVKKLLRERKNSERYKRSERTLTHVNLNVNHKAPLIYPITENIRTVNILASYKSTRDSLKLQLTESRRLQSGELIAKDNRITFKVKDKHIKEKNKTYYWQVVNTGSEAKEAGQLRGNFNEDNERILRREIEETTKYTGIHWVQCFIVKDDICIAKSPKFLVCIRNS